MKLQFIMVYQTSLIAVENRSHKQKIAYVALISFFDQTGRFTASG